MKLVKTALVLVLCIVWIYTTNYQLKPFNSVGELLSYKTGLLSVPIEENGINNYESDYKPNIYVDDLGIPHIYSDSQNDAAFGLGFMHAKDRYFQMELITRTVQGRMSEILSDKTLGSDSFWKPYEFERKSEELLETYKEKSPEFYEYLLAYAAGVNEYLTTTKSTDPLYKAIGSEPQMWKPQYSLLVTWYMSYTLTYFDQHVMHQEMVASLSEKEKKYFYPRQPEGLKTILPSTHTTVQDTAIAQYEEAVVVQNNVNEFLSPNKFEKGVGSNNWAVSKTKTNNQATMLANDPHLLLSLPEAFYEAHLIYGSLNIYGFSIPGVPVIVSGHNNVISWGITNGEWDLIDRYHLKVKDDNSYYYEGEWVPFIKKQYTIKIKGYDDYTMIQNNTVHGKVIKEGDQYYAQHWYASNKSYSIESMYKMMKSQNWDNFTSALKDYGYPPQNFIYSDVEDNIGIVCAGKLPDRGQNYRGGLLDGSLTYTQIKSIDTLWKTYNPDKKFLLSANQQPIQNDTYFGQHGLKDDYRVERIYNLLEDNDNWGLEEIQKMQSDQIDLSFNDFKGLLEKYKINKENAKIVALLDQWDGTMSSNSKEALVYESIRVMTIIESQKFAQSQLKVKLVPSFKHYVKYLKDDQYQLSGGISKQEQVNVILTKADSILTKRFGNQWEDTTYSEISNFSINNILSIPGLGEEINDASGNTNTINLNTGSIHPVYRAVYHMKKDQVKAYTVLAGGQSGQVNSIHYKDQLQLWRDGKHKETQFEKNPNQLKNIENIISFK